jgi:cell division protein FtsQ
MTAESIGQAALVKPGDHFFAVSSSKIEKQIKSLKMVESVSVTKYFPGVINIAVKEYPKVAYQFGENNQPQAILADGSIVIISKQMNFLLDKPILSGWTGNESLKDKLCQTMAAMPASYFTDISEIKPDPSESYPDKIKLYTRSQFEVVTTIGYMPEKLKYLDSYIANLKENKITTGVLRLLEADTHAPFDTDAGKANAKDSNTKDQPPKDVKTDKKPAPAPTPKESAKTPPAKQDNKPSGKDNQRN